jgi:hypothetical protein
MNELYSIVHKGKLLCEALSAHSGVLSSLRHDFDLEIIISNFQNGWVCIFLIEYVL